MPTDEAIAKPKLTPAFVELAYAYYPILIELARQHKRMTYGELVSCAKERYPSVIAVQNAIAVTAGKSLNVLRSFTEEFNLPDLSCLVYNKTTGECGGAYLENFDPILARSKVAEFDWSNASAEFELFMERSRNTATQLAVPKRLPKSKTIKKDDAATIRWKYYGANTDKFPKELKSLAEFIDNLIMNGVSVEEAFVRAMKKFTE